MFGIKRKATSVENESVGNVQFNSELIEELILQQSEIYANYKSLAFSIRIGSLSEVETELIHFKRSSQAHVMNKKARLYTYLKNELDLTVTQAHIVNKARLTGSEVSRSLTKFFDRYIHDGQLQIDKGHFPQLSDDLKDVGTLMVASMREERDRVFPLYSSP